VVVAPGGSLVFSPNNITELPGTVVQFGFNPKNHSVTQSNFADPCHPLDKGFNSGFIPTALSPSGVTFDIIVKDTKPVWFYCAQTTGDHCQKGMVGSINAPAEGNTLQAFIELAKKASTSTIGPGAPVNGVLSVNGTQVSSFDGDKPGEDGNLDGGDITYVPPPGTNTSSEVWNMAGGGQPDSYNWAPTISDNATSFLQLVELLDNVLLTVLVAGLEKLDADNGEWKHTYPESIVKIINAISAQALVHRATATDSLQHYGKPLSQTCNYTIPIDTVDDWLNTALAVLLLEIGVLIDVTTITAPTDPWLVPALVTEVGAKSRMTAVINLMQGHIAAAAPREAMLPAALGWSYATSHWLTNCQGSPPKGLPDQPHPVLEVVSTVKDNERTSKVTFKLGSDWSKQGKLWVAWVGEWGTLRLTALGDDGSADVPAELYGHVWAVIVSGRPGKMNELSSMTVAGPALVWVDQP
jgi:plastocyanin